MGQRSGRSRVEVECKVLDELPKSLLIEVEDGPRQRRVYIPLSCVHEIHRADGLIVVDEWIAEKESLI